MCFEFFFSSKAVITEAIMRVRKTLVFLYAKKVSPLHLQQPTLHPLYAHNYHTPELSNKSSFFSFVHSRHCFATPKYALLEKMEWK